MHGYIGNIEKVSKENGSFRKVLYTSAYCQLVLMSIPPGGEIGEEVHGLDQFIRVEAGEGRFILDGAAHAAADGWAIVVPAGASHNVVNTSATEPLKLYTLYSPPNHRDGVLHATRVIAEADSEHFDGKLSEPR
ncbi:MAG: cupin domain-containing protein [bacterium]|nr:cupin domain-containing protein [bacterium]